MKTAIALASLGLFALGCDGSTATTPTVDRQLASSTRTVGQQLLAGAQGNGVVHRVSVGSSDFSLPGTNARPGTNANFSLVAIEHADGSISGQWSDQNGHGVGGIHVDVNCLNVIGNEAWISGVVTSSSLEGTDLTGSPVITRVRDNGTSAQDPPDEISWSFVLPGRVISCLDPPYPEQQLFPISNGQVKVE